MELHGVASFPGVLFVEDCTYTQSMGTMPGTAILRCHPQPTLPAASGTLIISDGQGTVVLPNCKLDNMRVQTDSSGTVWILEIKDRRWRWREQGFVTGSYNQLDNHGKLIPWTIRSPQELAIQCLNGAGESRFVFDLPPGLPSSVGQNLQGLLLAGLNFPPTGLNPPIDWTFEPAMQALQGLAEHFGRRVTYDWYTDSVLIVQPGLGGPLPSGSIAEQSPSMKVPEFPEGICVVGAPTRFQFRVKLQAVGEDWDGKYLPINQLSYCPTVAAQAQKDRITLTWDQNQDPTGSEIVYKITVLGTTTEFRYLIDSNIAPATALNELGMVIQNDDQAARIISYTFPTVGDDGVAYMDVFALQTLTTWTTDELTIQNPANDTIRISVRTIQAGRQASRSWAYCPPPDFASVQATERLTRSQAIELAQRSVWKCYQISDQDYAEQGMIQVPGYGRLVRKQQLVPLETQVDQVVPSEAMTTATTQSGMPLIENFYNGYSRDKPAAVYGSISRTIGNAIFPSQGIDTSLLPSFAVGWWSGGANRGPNTPPGYRVFVDFSVDPLYQVITFSEHVFKLEDMRYVEPQLVLQTAFHVRNAGNNALERQVSYLPLVSNDKTKYLYLVREDVQMNITTSYSDAAPTATTAGGLGSLTGHQLLETDPVARANYYLAAAAIQYRISGSQTVTYNGIMPIRMDGAIQQITWEVGRNGAITKASLNTEHSIYVPPYPARRRIELMNPVNRPPRNVAERLDLWDPEAAR